MQFTLTTIREAKGLTIEEISKLCGVSVCKMKEYENDPSDLPASIVIKLRKTYGIPIDYIKV